MQPSRWQQIEELYHAALEREAGERAAFLAQADPELRGEVESLLAQKSGDGVLDRPAFEGAASLLGPTAAAVTPGTKLGPYRIEAPIGQGGMGEVFRAVDTRLGRAVAIKTSRNQLGERFGREARAISSLNHPHICALYDVGPNYLVMELCEGETLAARLKRGRLSIEETLRLGAQMADALSAAHAKGIVHRDLKPGNIILGKVGIKVLDFGLAKSQQDLTLTGSRVVMGTPDYMAPEQREGKECDARTDIYSLGLVLYEMATGKHPARGQIAQDILPLQLAPIIERCVATDPDDRWQSAQDVKAVLELAARTQPTVVVERSHRNWRRWGIVSVVALLMAALAILYFRGFQAEPPTPNSISFQVSPPEKVTLSADVLPAVSADGTRLAFGGLEPDGKMRLWVRALSSITAEPVLGSEGARFAFWSPDSHSIGFFAGGKLKRSDLDGAPPRILCDAPDALRPIGTWSRAGVILFNSADHPVLYLVPASGGEARPATVLDVSRQEIFHAWPQFLPDGRHFIYMVQSAMPENNGVYAGSLDSKVSKRIVNAGKPFYAGLPAGNGFLLFMRAATLMAQPFDAARLELQGDAFPVTEPVLLPPAPGPGFGAFSASANGVLAYQKLVQVNTELVWFDRQGRRLSTVGQPANYSVLTLSPDEKRLAVTRVDAQIGTRDLWLFDLASGRPSRFTFDPAEETNPTWSPSSDRIAFSSERTIYQKTADGTGGAEPLLESGEFKSLQSWTPDGRFILYDYKGKLWSLPLTGDRKPIALLTESGESRAVVSPNKKWLAYESSSSGRTEISVEPFPPTGAKWQVSTGGGAEPYWRGDGKEMFYLEGNRLMVVDVNPDGPIFHSGVPKPLFEMRLEVEARRSRYQVAANGQRFLVNVPLESNQPAAITVVTNWTAGLKR